MIGTLVNVATVITGSVIGILLKKKLHEKFITASFHVIGIFTLLLGIMMGLKSQHLLLQIISLLTGAWLGEWMDIDQMLISTEKWIKKKFNADHSVFFEGLILAFLLFCAGSMTILGALEEGLTHNPHLLFIKSVMDGISAIALSIAFGWGVIFSVIPLFLYQAGLTLFSAHISQYLQNELIVEVSATGGFILIALALSLLNIKKIKVINLLPALLMVIVFSYLFKWLNFS